MGVRTSGPVVASHLTLPSNSSGQRPVGNKSDSLSDKQLQIISEKHGGYDTFYQTVVTVLHITLYMHNKHKVVK